MIRPSSAAGQAVMTVNDNYAAVNFPIKVSPAETVFTFANEDYTSMDALIHHLTIHKLSSKSAGGDYHLTTPPAGKGLPSPYASSKDWVKPAKGGEITRSRVSTKKKKPDLNAKVGEWSNNEVLQWLSYKGFDELHDAFYSNGT